MNEPGSYYFVVALGATGVTPSDVVFSTLREKYPQFASKCEREGVRYTIYSGPEQDATKGVGRSWKSFFHVANREECEQKMREGGWSWSWGEGPPGVQVPANFLKCTTPRLDAIKFVPGTSRRCFFNQLIATLANALEFSKVGTREDGDVKSSTPTQAGIDACVRFADGDPVKLDILLDAKSICERNAVDIQWKKGDVALVCNYSMMHARRPWGGAEGTRKLLASLVQEKNLGLQTAGQLIARL